MVTGYLALLYSTSDKPLEYWSKQKSRTGSIRRLLDEDLNENVLEIQDAEDSNYQKTWIMSPPDKQQILNIKLPFLILLMKNKQSQFSFQLQIVDKENVRHLIHFSNIELKKGSVSKSAPLRIHLLLEPGWNKLEIDLSHLSKIFGIQFEAVYRLKITANCRIRRIYFIDKHYDDNEIVLGLYQGFFDTYMLKWGINTVERAVQVKKLTNSKANGKDNSLHPTIGFNKLFLKHLQAKSDKIIEEFFSKQPIKSIKDYLEFKRKAKIKPYAIPDGNKMYNQNLEGSDSSSIDINEIKKYFLRENILHGKLSFEEKNDKKDKKLQEFKENKDDLLQSANKFHQFKFSEKIERKISVGKTNKRS